MQPGTLRPLPAALAVCVLLLVQPAELEDEFEFDDIRAPRAHGGLR